MKSFFGKWDPRKLRADRQAGRRALRGPASLRNVGLVHEPLEDRRMLTTIFAINNTTGNLIQFDSATPGTLGAAIPAITGLQTGERIEALDFRPATGQLFALGILDAAAVNPATTDEGRIYVINTTTGAATLVGSGPFSIMLAEDANYGFDFNPTVDRIRIVNDAGQNLRVNPNDGALTTDTNLSMTNIVGAAYDRNAGGASDQTTLYAINRATNALATIGGINGTPSPNLGAVTDVGALGITPANQSIGFDIFSSSAAADVAYLSATVGAVTSLYTVNLATGAASAAIGPIGAGNFAVRGLAAIFSGEIVVGGTAGNDPLVVTATSANAGTYQLGTGPVIPFTGITRFTFDGGAGNDTLTINNPAGSLFAPTGGIFYNGGAQAGVPGDTLQNLGGGGAAFTGRYTPTSTNNGTITTTNGTITQTINFTGLEPVLDTTAMGTFTIDLTAAADTANITDGPVAGQTTVGDGPGGNYEDVTFSNKTNVVINGFAGVDTFNLNNPNPATGLTMLSAFGHQLSGVGDDNANDLFLLTATGAAVTSNLFGQGGSDRLNNFSGITPFGNENLAGVQGAISFTGGETAADNDEVLLSNFNRGTAPALVTITNTAITGAAGAAAVAITYAEAETFVYGGTNASDTIDVTSTAAGTNYGVYTNDGAADVVTIGNTTANYNTPTFNGSLTGILGPITISNDTGANAGPAANDTLNIDDSGSATPLAAATISNIGATAFSFGGFTDTAPTTRLAGFAPGAVNIDYQHGTSSFGDADDALEFLNVRASAGNDFITVNATTATNTTTVEGVSGNDTFVIVGNTLSANNIFRGEAPGAPAAPGNDDFFLNIAASLGSTATTPITGLQIAGNGNGAVAGPTGTNRDRLIINDDNAGFVRNLDYTYQAGGGGGVDIGAGVAGTGLFGANLAAGVVQVRSMESLIFSAEGAANDVVRVFGTAGNDVLTVAQVPTVAASAAVAPSGLPLLEDGTTAGSSALVFLNGAPYLGTPPVALVNPANLPGVSGGGTGPDLLLNGLAAAGLLLNGNGNTFVAPASGDRAVVYGASESALTQAANTTDLFGFGAGVLQPAFGAVPGNAFDTFTIATIGANTNVATVNNTSGTLVPVNIVTASFVQNIGPTPPAVHVSSEQAALIVNGGDEAGVRGAGVNADAADIFNVPFSTSFNIQVNGNLPGLTTGPNGQPRGDQLNATVTGSANVFSDNANPPNITVTGTAVFGVKFSSIERAFFMPTNGVVNLIGDNNTAGVEQNDFFEVRGQDIDFNPNPLPGDGTDTDGVNEFALRIGTKANQGAAPVLGGPIFFRNVTRIRASGGSSTGFTATGDSIPEVVNTGIDTFDATPYADNTPRGWGIESYWNEGDPIASGDLLTINGMPAISENFRIQPSAAETGQVSVINSATNTPIAVFNFVLDAPVIFNGNDGTLGDTDVLTMRGTDPANGSTSGNEDVVANFTAAGNALNPIIRVYDAGVAPPALRPSAAEIADTAGALANILYSIQSVTNIRTFNFEMLGGADVVRIAARTDNNETVNVNGGNGSDTVIVATALPVAAPVAANTVDEVIYTPGVDSGSGKMRYENNANAPLFNLNFTGLEPVIDTVAAATLTINATNAENAINYTVGPNTQTAVVGGAAVNSGLVSVDAFESVEFANKVALVINALAGSDAINLNTPTTPTGLTGITVNGGDPSTTNRLTITGSTAADTVNITPTGANAATVAINGAAPITAATIETLIYNGLGGTDLLTVTTPAASTTTYNPGVTPDSASLQVNSLVPISYLNLGSAAQIVQIAAGAGSTLVYNGTANSDTFTVNAGTPATDGRVVLNTQLPLETSGVTNLTLNGLAGDDTFNLAATLQYTGTITVDGGSPTASDVLNLTGAAGAVAVDLPSKTITGYGGTVAFPGIETVNLGGVAGSSLTVTGTAGSELYRVQPTAATNGNFTAASSGAVVSTYPNFTYTGIAGAVTFTGGAGGFDTLAILGDDGADAITSGAATVTRAGGTVTLGAGLDRLEVYGFAGNDNIDLDITVTPLQKMVDAGAGDDIVNLVGSVDAVSGADIFGGIGNDTLTGTPQVDNIFGGAGNDIIIGAGGADNEYGEDGNDIFGNPGNAANGVADDPGADFMFGGDGIDNFVWEPGDGADIMQGGVDEADILRFFGAQAAAAETFTLAPAGAAPTHFNITINAGPTIDTHGIEQLIVDGLSGGDTYVVADLYPTEIKAVNLVLGTDALADPVTVNGRQTADNVLINTPGAGLVRVAGLRYDVNLSNVQVVNDTLTFNGNEGDDTIKANPLVENVVGITLNGNDGDDFLSADATLNGGAGDDFLEGGAGADTLNGGAGEDTMVGNGGNDTFNGGPDFDTVLYRGTSGNDVISAIQNTTVVAGDTIVTTLNGVTDTDTIVPNGANRVERVKIEARDGDDTILVRHLDALGIDGVVNSVRFDVDGGADFTRDRLSVQDDGLAAGTGDLVLYRKGEDDSKGSITVGPGNAEALENVFQGIEFVQPIAGNGGQVLVFKHDPFEFNDERINATFLGSGATINVDPTIDPGAVPAAQIPAGFDPVPGDQDFYRFVVEKTGTLDIQVYFTQVGPVASGRPGLPNSGNLDIELYDVDGTLIVDGVAGAPTTPEFGLNDATDNERIRIPAVEGQTYYLRVFANGTAINNYTLTAINTPAPVPFDLELDDRIFSSTTAPGGSDTTFSSNAFLPVVPQDPSPVDPPDGFFVGKYVSFLSGPLNGQRGLVDTYTGATRTFTFVAGTFTGAPGAGASFQVESGDTGRSQFENHTRDTTPTIFIRVPDSALLNDIPDNGNAPGSPPDEVIPIQFLPDTNVDVPNAPAVGARSGFRVAVFLTEENTHVPVGFAQPVDPVNLPGVYSFTFPAAAALTPDGSYFISARVEIIDPAQNVNGADLAEQAQGFGAFSQSIEVFVDTTPPRVSFGQPGVDGDGLTADSDSGVSPPNPDTLIDRVTSDTTPTFWGRAEANAIVRLFVDHPTMGTLGTFDPFDLFIGQDTALAIDGSNQFPEGFWTIESVLNLNGDPPFPLDGLRTIFVTAEDLAGNLNVPGDAFGDDEDEILEIFLDTQGPQIFDPDDGGPDQAIQIITDSATLTIDTDYNLFGIKPGDAPQGHTPLVEGLRVNIRDLPARVANFLYVAIKEDVAEFLGQILVRGDHTGIQSITAIDVNNNPPVAGEAATATLDIFFARALPDDRFTLIIPDTAIIDLANNALDGESDADEPNGAPFFPTGNGIPGGDFLARFTVDSRPEVGTYAGGIATIDINGNQLWDPEGINNDATNRDLSFAMAVAAALQGTTSSFSVHDSLFAGKFIIPDTPELAFDSLALYGFDPKVGSFRWLIDMNHDGAIDEAVGDIFTTQPAGFQINGLPVAGEFDGDTTNGDEVALFDGTRWWFDGDHSFVIGDSVLDFSFTTQQRGMPIVGDFDGDGFDDLGTWRSGVFSFDFDFDGTIDSTINFDFPGTQERPVAADMDQDGIDDIGLYIPGRRTNTDFSNGQFYFLISNDPLPVEGPRPIDPANGGALNHPFAPTPLGFDLSFDFGDEFSLPIVGNFDPPVSNVATPVSPTSMGTVHAPLVVDSESLAGEKLYSFDVVRPGTLTVDLGANRSSGGVTVQLLDAQRNLLSSAVTDAAGKALISHAAKAGQSVMLRLIGHNWDVDVKVTNQIADNDLLDVDGDGHVSGIDVVTLVAALNTPSNLRSAAAAVSSHVSLDTDQDGHVSGMDLLRVLAHINTSTSSFTSSITASVFANSDSASEGSPAGDNADVARAVDLLHASSTPATPAATASQTSLAAADTVFADLEPGDLDGLVAALLGSADASDASDGSSNDSASDDLTLDWEA